MMHAHRVSGYISRTCALLRTVRYVPPLCYLAYAAKDSLRPRKHYTGCGVRDAAALLRNVRFVSPLRFVGYRAKPLTIPIACGSTVSRAAALLRTMPYRSPWERVACIAAVSRLPHYYNYISRRGRA